MAKQGAKAKVPWSWVESAVWTERMLEALHRGVKGGMWFSLIDKAISMRNLEAAWARVQSNKGAAGLDRKGIGWFKKNAERELLHLQREMKEGRYRPKPVLRRHIPKPGSSRTRPLGIPTVRDRVAQQALRQTLEPIFEKIFVETSYGFRPQRGSKDALRRVQDLLNEGYTWVVDADIQSFFDEIDRKILMSDIEEQIADGRVLEILGHFLNQDVFELCRVWRPPRGTPQGAVISPLFANIYLHPVDVRLREEGLEVARYADDLVIMCRTEAEAERGLQILREALAERQLQLHPEKTKLVDATQRGGFEFLGYLFEQGKRFPRRKSRQALRERIRPLTKRTNGRSMKSIVARLNPLLRGWYEYFKHGHPAPLKELDGWIRMRLRSILRKRHGAKGRGRGIDQVQWPNAHFRELGLFFMAEAQAAELQSRRG